MKENTMLHDDEIGNTVVNIPLTIKEERSAKIIATAKGLYFRDQVRLWVIEGMKKESMSDALKKVG